MRDIRVERFTKKLDCGATVIGFREIVVNKLDPGIIGDEIEPTLYEEEN